jgi:hypothetical protein
MAFVAEQAYQDAITTFGSPVAEQAQAQVNSVATTTGGYVGLTGSQTSQIVNSIAQGAVQYQKAEESGDPWAKSDAVAGTVIGVLAVLAPYGTVCAAVLAGLYALGRAIGIVIPKDYVSTCQPNIVALEAHILATVWKVLQASASQYQLDWIALLGATNKFLIENNSPFLIELRPAHLGELDLDPQYQGAPPGQWAPNSTGCQGSAAYLGFPVWKNAEGVPVTLRLLVRDNIPPFNAKPSFGDMGPEWFLKVEAAQKKTRELLGAAIVEAVRGGVEQRDTQRLLTDAAIAQRIKAAARDFTRPGESYGQSVSSTIAAYNAYKKSGGTLGFGHWSSAGKPLSSHFVYKPSLSAASDVAESLDAYRSYQSAGGQLQFGEWSNEGKPVEPLQNERPANTSAGGSGGGGLALLLLPVGLLGALALGSKK